MWKLGYGIQDLIARMSYPDLESKIWPADSWYLILSIRSWLSFKYFSLFGVSRWVHIFFAVLDCLLPLLAVQAICKIMFSLWKYVYVCVRLFLVDGATCAQKTLRCRLVLDVAQRINGSEIVVFQERGFWNFIPDPRLMFLEPFWRHMVLSAILWNCDNAIPLSRFQMVFGSSWLFVAVARRSAFCKNLF